MNKVQQRIDSDAVAFYLSFHILGLRPTLLSVPAHNF
jgi:hypothetical protein